MDIKRVVVEKIEDSGQVLAIAKTTDNETFLTRHNPITNRLSYIEDRRINAFNKEPFQSKIFFASIPTYSDLELKEYLPNNLNMLKHKGNQDRICLTGLQRSNESWYKLTPTSALKTAKTFIENKVKIIPLEIPFNLGLAEVKKLKQDCSSILNPNQKIALDIHSYSNREDLKEILEFEINENSLYFFITARTINNIVSLANYATIWDVTRKIKEGSHIPIIVGKGIERYQDTFSNVSSTFALNAFNIGVVAERFYYTPPLTKQEFNKKLPDDYIIYSSSEGGFIKSKIQEALDGYSILKETFKNNNLFEGVGPAEAIHCSNFVLQQQDTSLQNDAILNNNFLETIKQKARWLYVYTEHIRKKQLEFN